MNGSEKTLTDLDAAWDLVRGIQPLSLCDWPGRTVAVLFLGGCNLRCPMCHNGDLAWRHETLDRLDRSDVMSFLVQRKKWLDGIVISGGEPTCAPDLVSFLEDLSQVDLPLKVDSNGQRPDVLEDLLRCGPVEHFAVDVKGPYRTYPEITGQAVTVADAQERLRRVFDLAAHQPEAFSFRMTRLPAFSDHEIEETRRQLPPGFSLTIQKFQYLS